MSHVYRTTETCMQVAVFLGIPISPWPSVAHRRTEVVGHFPSRVMVFQMGANLGTRFCNTAKFALPVAVEGGKFERVKLTRNIAAELAIHRFQTGNPQPRGCVVFIENESFLLGGFFSLLGFADGRDELGGPARLKRLLCGLPLVIQLPMLRRALVRGIQDGVHFKPVSHSIRPPSPKFCTVLRCWKRPYHPRQQPVQVTH